MIRTGKKFSKPERSRVINGDKQAKNTVINAKRPGQKLVKIGEFEEELPEKPEKVRLDVLMSEIYKSYNRSTLQKFIEFGFVTVDGEIVKKANRKFERNVKIELKVPETMKNADLVPGVIYEDDQVLVLDKPTGLLSMAKGQYCPENTLERYGLLVHRLDRDTSGVVILAKDLGTQLYLKKQFQNRTTHKTYYAIVVGRPKLDAARIDLPIMRDLKHPTTFRVEAGGKPSETFYKVIKSNKQYTLLELKPTTGRTHQLRVHLKYLGCPILGDTVYGNGEKAGRLYLHAGALEITLPGGQRTTFRAKLPAEFARVMRESEVGATEKAEPEAAANARGSDVF